MRENEGQEALSEIEAAHPEGMSIHQVVASCGTLGERLTEATFRKYVQLGLLPRSVRVGRKGKHRGSQGLYPSAVVRQVLQIRRLMAQGFTIEDIQTRLLTVGGDVGALEKELGRVTEQLTRVAPSSDLLLKREIEEVGRLASALIQKLRDIERRLTVQARMERAAV